MSTESQNSSSIKPVLLVADNWHVWARRIKTTLHKESVWYTIQATKEYPTEEDTRSKVNEWSLQEYQYRWTEDSAEAYDIIMAYCDITRQEEIEALSVNGVPATAAQVWDHLEKTYKKSNTEDYVQVWRTLLNIKIPWGEEKVVQEALDNYNRASDKIQMLGFDVSKVLTTLLLLAADEKYSAVVDTLLTNVSDADKLTRAVVGQKLVSRTKYYDHGSKETKAMVSKTTGGRRNHGKGRPGRNDKPKPHRDSNRDNNSDRDRKDHDNSDRKPCPHCRAKSHNGDQCWKKHPEKAPHWMKEKIKYDEELRKKRNFTIGESTN